MRKKPTPTADDWQRVEEKLQDPEGATRQLKEYLARSEAYQRVARERAERRHRLLRRFVPFAR